MSDCKKYYIVMSLLVLSLTGRADEGMWLVNLMERTNYELMKAKGLKLTAREIYSETIPSLKDAVVALDHGSCTGSIVSSGGLMITNHHCAYDNIRALSNMEHDYLKNGFWAKNPAEEITIPGKTVTFLDRVLDVTSDYRAIADSLRNSGKPAPARRINMLIERKYAKKGYELDCVSMSRGDSYFLFYYKEYKDIRLVAAPPSCFGTFGGDTDNWTWPQHKADFALYRVYTSPDGEPAAYSAENKPLIPKKVLKLSTAGVKPGDYAMVIGYPGSTTRYMPSWGITEKIEMKNPATIQVRKVKMDILREAMENSPQAHLQYASEYFSCANYWKYALGENEFLKRYRVVDIRQKEETELAEWVNSRAELREKYGDILKKLQENYKIRAPFVAAGEYHMETLLNGPLLRTLFFRLYGVEKGMEHNRKRELSKDDPEIVELKKDGGEFFRDFNEQVDRKMFAEMFRLYAENLPPDYLPVEIRELVKKFNSDYVRLADYVYDHSFMTDLQRFTAFVSRKVKRETILKDIAYLIFNSAQEIESERRTAIAENDNQNAAWRTTYTHALMEMRREKGIVTYPDANSTMRITYGQVGGFCPQDAIQKAYCSTIAGYTEKYKKNDPEFDLNADCLDAIKRADWGNYADKDGKLHTGFLCDLDITGGNSGSPVLNSRGELIGLAYDAGWESMAGAFYFHPDYNKCVCVDIRFILWIMDKYAGTANLLREFQFAV